MKCVALAHHALARDLTNISLATIDNAEWLVHSALCVIDSSQTNVTGSSVLFVKGISAWILVCVKAERRRQTERKNNSLHKMENLGGACHKNENLHFTTCLCSFADFKGILGKHSKTCQVQGQSHLNCILIVFSNCFNLHDLGGTVPLFSLERTFARKIIWFQKKKKRPWIGTCILEFGFYSIRLIFISSKKDRLVCAGGVANPQCNIIYCGVNLAQMIMIEKWTLSPSGRERALGIICHLYLCIEFLCVSTVKRYH